MTKRSAETERYSDNERTTMSNTRFLPIILLLMAIIIFPVDGQSIAQTETIRDYWPTDEWQTSTPEEQGMKSAILNELMTKIDEDLIAIDSLLIVKNGYMVLEEYPGSIYDQDNRHIIHFSTGWNCN